MEYYITAFITFISATLGLAFSIGAVKNGNGLAKTNALYMFARSASIVLIALIPLCIKANSLLTTITSAMLIIQAIDGLVGIYIKNRMRTIGPFIMATLHAICLCIYL